MNAPFVMYYDKQPMTHGILVHKLIVPPLTAVFADIWAQCGQDQAAVDQTGASDWGGCFNIRNIAGSNNWSNHSWAGAIVFALLILSPYSARAANDNSPAASKAALKCSVSDEQSYSWDYKAALAARKRPRLRVVRSI